MPQLSEMVRVRISSTALIPRRRVLGDKTESRLRLVPKAIQPVGRRFEARLVEEIDIACTFSPMRDQLRPLELRQVTRHGGTADGELGSKFTHTARPVRKREYQPPSLGIAEGLKGEIRKGGRPIS